MDRHVLRNRRTYVCACHGGFLNGVRACLSRVFSAPFSKLHKERGQRKMNFNSLGFLIFLFVVVLLYWLIPHKFRWVLLLLASYFFYMSWNVKLILLILTTTITAYGFGILIEKTQSGKLKRFFLVVTLLICLGILIFFKYINFIIGSVTALLTAFGLNFSTTTLNILLPVGISFYTFQTLSYVIDVYRGTVKAERHFGYFALYVSYFPQLVAGPIERSEDLLPQLKEERRFDFDNIREGFRFLLSGFFRKCVIADFCGLYVDTVYARLGTSNSLAIFFASGLFLIQMYNDFAGYSEIALGTARLMGVKLTKNFDKPLISASYTEFFRRWHITLNQWFTRYVYIPLGGNRKGLVRKLLNTMIVFLLCGLWHGANWTYVLWGGVAGVIICLETLLKQPCIKLLKKMRINLQSETLLYIRRGIMLCLFSLSSVLFRAQSIVEIGLAFENLFTAVGFGEAYWTATFEQLGMNAEGVVYLILCFAVMLFLPGLTEERGEKSCALMGEGIVSDKNTAMFFFGICTIGFCWLAILSKTDVSGFQYFQF